MMASAAPGLRRTVFAAYALSATACIIGLVFCLIKSPQARSEAYVAAAVELAGEQRLQTAITAAAEAVRLDPANKKGWNLLAALLQQNGDHRASLKASRMAARLGGEGTLPAPVYALPAALKLSYLGDGNMVTP